MLAGEGHLVHARVGDDRSAGRGTIARHDVDDAVGDAGLQPRSRGLPTNGLSHELLRDLPTRNDASKIGG